MICKEFVLELKVVYITFGKDCIMEAFYLAEHIFFTPNDSAQQIHRIPKY